MKILKKISIFYYDIYDEIWKKNISINVFVVKNINHNKDYLVMEPVRFMLLGKKNFTSTDSKKNLKTH